MCEAKEVAGYPSQTGRLHFHRCSFCFWSSWGDGLAEGAGSLSGCCEPSDEGTAFHQLFLGFRSLAGPRKDKRGGVAKPKMFSLARHLS